MALSGSLNFLSASIVGSVRAPGASDPIEIFYGKEENSGGQEFVPNDFVGLNTNIYEPISASSNTLGYHEFAVGVIPHPGGSAYANYITTYAGGRPTNFFASEDQAAVLNGLLHHRNGPYQHPSWKQIRGGQHPVARRLRLYNTMSVDLDEPSALAREDEKRLLRSKIESFSLREADEYFKNNLRHNTGSTFTVVDPLTGIIFGTMPTPGRRGPTLKRYYEPSVLIKHKPFIYDFTNISLFGETATVRSTLMNQMVFFENQELNEALKIAGTFPLSGTQALKGFKTPNQEYYNLIDVAKSDGVNARNFIYSQMIFPKSINVFRPFKLDKPNFEEIAGLESNGYDRLINRSFWRDVRHSLSSSIVSDGTTRIRTADVALNSQNIAQSLTMSTDNGSATYTNVVGARNLFSTPAPTLYNWNHEQKFIQGGIIASDAIWTLTGSAAAVGTLDVRTSSPSDVNADTFVLSDVNRDQTFTFNSSTTAVINGIIGVSGVSTRYAMAVAIKNAINDASINLLITASEPSPGVGSPGDTQIITLTQDTAGYSGNTAIDVTGVTNVSADPAFFTGGYSMDSNTRLLTGTLDAPPTYLNNETHNPYPIALLSMWPLDVREDIFEGIWSAGRPGMENIYNAPPQVRSEGVYLSASLSDSAVSPNGDIGSFNLKNLATGSYLQLTNIMTGTAGELVYSTKPTMFFHKQENIKELIGYKHQTASLQYNRHTFPYNTPFYATNKVRGRNPFFNSYSDFMTDVKYLAREYSIIPEYRVSENIDYQVENYFKGAEMSDPLYSKEQRQYFIIDLDSSKPELRKVSYYKRNIKPTGEALMSIDGEGFLTTNPSTLKLNFLSLHGADPTSSATAESFFDQTSSQANYNFDTLSLDIENVVDNFSTSKIVWSQDPEASKFYQKYSNTNNIIDFSHIIEKLEDGKDTIPSKIEFTVYALKKLLPYKNFYPVTKTVDIGNRFKNFIYGNLDTTPKESYNSEGEPTTDYGYEIGHNSVWYDTKPGALQSFLEPFMAPGILYNSLKSGLGVDFPVYEDKPAYFAPFSFISGTVDPRSEKAGSFKHTGWSTNEWQNGELATGYENGPLRFAETVTGSFNYGGFQMLGASRCIPAILNRPATARLPFYSMYNLSWLNRFAEGESIYLTTDFLDLDINGPVSESLDKGRFPVVGAQAFHHPGYAYTNAGPRGKLKEAPGSMTTGAKKLYEMSINNFLCETMNFFLDDQEGVEGLKLPVVVGDLVSDYAFSNSTAYAMEVSLEMGLHHVMAEGPRNAGIGGGSLVDNRYANSSLNASMRGYIYGPPVEIVQMSGSTTTTEFVNASSPFLDPGAEEFHTEPYIASPVREGLTNATDGSLKNITGAAGDYESYFGANLQDPAYQAYTPPYFYGKSSLVLVLPEDHTLNDPTNESNLNSPEAILSYLDGQTQKKNIEHYVTGATPSALCRYLPGTSSISYNQAPGSGRMKVGSCIQVRGLFDPAPITFVGPDKVRNGYMSYISPWWTCPVLDFSSSYSSVKTHSKNAETGEKSTLYAYVTNSFHTLETGRGLWGGYGTDPYSYGQQTIHKHILKGAGTVDGEYQKGVYLNISYPYAINKISASSNTVFSENLSANPGISAIFTDEPQGLVDRPLIYPTGSLGRTFGLLRNEQDSIRRQIGRMAKSKDVSEAVVIIPYFEKRVHVVVNTQIKQPGRELDFFTTREIIPGKHFLPINKRIFQSMLTLNILKRQFEIYNPGMLEKTINPDNKTLGLRASSEYQAAQKTDVYRLIDLLMNSFEENRSGYELPPEFDFINYDIDPFQMVVVPLQHTLTSQELVDVYQGLMPDSSLKATKVRNTVDINPAAPISEFNSWMPVFKDADKKLHTLAPLSPQNFLTPAFINAKKDFTINIESSINQDWLENSQDFYKNLKFMVFKIKQRGTKNYENYREKQIELAIINKAKSLQDPDENIATDVQGQHGLAAFKKPTTLSDVFGYNWPYDDFSLAEAVKIDIGVEVKQ